VRQRKIRPRPARYCKLQWRGLTNQIRALGCWTPPDTLFAPFQSGSGRDVGCCVDAERRPRAAPWYSSVLASLAILSTKIDFTRRVFDARIEQELFHPLIPSHRVVCDQKDANPRRSPNLKFTLRDEVDGTIESFSKDFEIPLFER
jgi:hypothetical protein